MRAEQAHTISAAQCPISDLANKSASNGIQPQQEVRTGSDGMGIRTDLKGCNAVLLEMTEQGERDANFGDKIGPLVAGTESGKHTGLTYFITQQELQQLVETERLTELSLMGRTLQGHCPLCNTKTPDLYPDLLPVVMCSSCLMLPLTLLRFH